MGAEYNRILMFYFIKWLKIIMNNLKQQLSCIQDFSNHSNNLPTDTGAVFVFGYISIWLFEGSCVQSKYKPMIVL